MPLLLLVSAPSGAGKTTVTRGLLAANSNLRRVVTCTTRTPRPGEKDGLDYHFLAPEEFHRRVDAGQFLEHAEVYGRAYGTPISGVLELFKSGYDALLVLDVQGAATVQGTAATHPDFRDALSTVFLTPDSLAEVERRLRGRGSEPEAALQRRLAEARKEISRWPKFDYLIVSSTREEDLRRLQAIYDAERLRTSRSELRLEEEKSPKRLLMQ